MEQAIERRIALEPDIVLGALELWIGVGANMAWPWIDVAVRIGKGWGVFVDHHGPMVKRPDFAAFVPALRDFAEKRRDDVFLGSLGGSTRITLRRSEHDSLYGEAWFNHGASSQTVSFSIWDAVLPAAVEGAEAALERVKAARRGEWVPSPDPLSLLPHATGLIARDPPQRFEAWESELVPATLIEFAYQVDGYGWYGVEVKADDKSGSFGGSWLTDGMGDLLRAGLAMLAGAVRAELTCNAEPGATRVEFERVSLRTTVTESGLPERHDYGCWIRIRDLDQFTNEPRELEFEALARSPRDVAEAIYLMAVHQFADGAGPWTDAMAALEGALASVPPPASRFSASAQESGTP